MAKASSPARAPRGTKILAKAFFTAADEIPEPQRADVVKAALALIRDELKATREKAAVAKAKAKAKAPATAKVSATSKAGGGTKSGKPPAAASRKGPEAAMKPAAAKKKATSKSAKSPMKRSRKAAAPPAEATMPEPSSDTTFSTES